MAERPVSALVVMKPATDPQAVERARRFFEEQGFEVGPFVGTSFSIAAPRQRMDRWFGGFERLEGSGEELPLDALPADIRGTLHAVTTEAPPDFGPGNP